MAIDRGSELRREQDRTLVWQRSLYQRVIFDGIILVEGEDFIYLNGDNVESRTVTKQDIEKVMSAVEAVKQKGRKAWETAHQDCQSRR